MIIDLEAMASVFGFITVAGGAMAVITKWITGSLQRDVTELRRDNADLNTRLTSLDSAHAQTLQRVIRTEVAIHGLEKTLDRVERTITDRFDDLKEAVAKK